MNEYEKMMHKKEKDKAIGKVSLVIIVISLLIISAIAGSTKTEKEKVEAIVRKNFNTISVHEGEGSWTIIVSDDSYYDRSFDRLRMTYIELSKARLSKGVLFMVAEDNDRGLFRYKSKASKKSLKSIKWRDIESYEEFKEKANIEQIKHSW